MSGERKYKGAESTPTEFSLYVLTGPDVEVQLGLSSQAGEARISACIQSAVTDLEGPD